MNALFLVICGVSVVFFVVFLFECSRPSRRAQKAPLVSTTNGSDIVDLTTRRRFFANLEQQMAELLSHHGRTAAVLLIALVLGPIALRAQGAGSDNGQTEDSSPTTSASSLSREPEQNSGADAGSPQSGSSSSDDPKAVGVKETAGSNDADAADSSTLHGNFFSRLGQAYMQDWKGTASSGPTPSYRGFPSPLTIPPYPFADWPYGGSVVIGKPWTQTAPLMQAIWSGSSGEAWKRSGIQIYGWFNGGFDFSTSTTATMQTRRQPTTCAQLHSAGPTSVLYRAPTGHGTDRSLRLGFPLSANLGHRLPLHHFQRDIQPAIAGPSELRRHLRQRIRLRPRDVLWRFLLSPCRAGHGSADRALHFHPDIEAQLAPNNYTYSHSLLYSYDCYTQVGLMTTTKLNNHWLIQAGISPGCDVAPWDSTDAKLTLTLGFQYTWNDGKDAIYPCLERVKQWQVRLQQSELHVCHLVSQVSKSSVSPYFDRRLVHVGKAGTECQ